MNDRPSVTETDRGGVFEMDRQTNRQKKEMPLKLIKFFTGTRMCYYIWSISVAFQCFLHFSIYPFQRHLLFPFLWHLVCDRPSVHSFLRHFLYNPLKISLHGNSNSTPPQRLHGSPRWPMKDNRHILFVENSFSGRVSFFYC